MNINSLINMVIRAFVRNIVNRGVKASIDTAVDVGSRRGRKSRQQPVGEIDDFGNSRHAAPPQTRTQPLPQGHQQQPDKAADAKQQQRAARRAVRAARRAERS